ncbi:MAG: carboxypeptidase regulatory-like domain-containing protein [Gemmatimonadetes bacterium]|nr:carboxypeptidase regulatory-like domain-containing protein [Gemmatimonadota bacterium]
MHLLRAGWRGSVSGEENLVKLNSAWSERRSFRRPAPVATHGHRCVWRRPTSHVLAIFAVVAAIAGGTDASAQAVRGRLMDLQSSEGVGGAMMTLVDRQDSHLGSTLTRASGLFEIEAPSPGRYRVKAERIGYATAWSDYFEIDVGDTLAIEIAAQVEAISLEGIEVQGEARCRVRPEEGLAVARVWDEARKALAAAAWTQERGIYRYEMLHITRDLDPDGRTVTWEDRVLQQSLRQSPYRARPAAELIESGFARLTADESSYFAPDAAVLLSDPFLDTHCFRLRRDARRAPGLIGLAFEPVPGRRLPEIAGTLWLDPADGELQWLDFRYVNLPLPVPLARAASGRVDFKPMPNGTWIVESWQIRMPQPVSNPGPFARVRLGGVAEEGGEILRAHLNEGKVLEGGLGGRIAGIVFDSLHIGLPGARVFIDGTDLEVLTGQDGRFELTHLRTGTYTVNFSHPYLDRLRFRPSPVEVDVVEEARTPARIEFAAPAASAALERLCRERDRTTVGEKPGTWDRSNGAGVLLGRVTDPAGVPLEGVNVRIGAREYEVTRADGDLFQWHNAMVVTTDENGRYVGCGVPVDRFLRVAVLRSGWGPSDERSTDELLSYRAAWLEEVVRISSGQLLAIVDFEVEMEPRSP